MTPRMTPRMNRKQWLTVFVFAFGAACAQADNAPATGVAPATAGETETVTAVALIEGALDLMRGVTSYTAMSMTVHRPDWQRSSALVAWTRGRDDALIRFVAPARDAGNATLKTGDKMWTYTPKLNRTIRLPYSLMSQSWAGSDFSYNDLSRTDDILRYYDMTITDVREEDGHKIYTLEGIPHEDSPVVWGKEVWVLRDDYVLISQSFYDQSMELLKQLETTQISELGGRVMSTRMRMNKIEEPENYTEISYTEAEFDIELEDRTFTVFALQSGGRR